MSEISPLESLSPEDQASVREFLAGKHIPMLTASDWGNEWGVAILRPNRPGHVCVVRKALLTDHVLGVLRPTSTSRWPFHDASIADLTKGILAGQFECNVDVFHYNLTQWSKGSSKFVRSSNSKGHPGISCLPLDPNSYIRISCEEREKQHLEAHSKGGSPPFLYSPSFLVPIMGEYKLYLCRSLFSNTHYVIVQGKDDEAPDYSHVYLGTSSRGWGAKPSIIPLFAFLRLLWTPEHSVSLDPDVSLERALKALDSSNVPTLIESEENLVHVTPVCRGCSRPFSAYHVPTSVDLTICGDYIKGDKGPLQQRIDAVKPKEPERKGPWRSATWEENS